MSTPAKPNDRKLSAAEERKLQAKREEVLRNLLSTGVDLTPLTVDIGDGIVWNFNPDPMPAQTNRLQKALGDLETAQKDATVTVDDLEAATGALVESLRDVILDAKQKKEFPKPNYGSRALVFFSLSVAAGRSGFPTKEA